MTLILASKSVARANMLKAAGLDFDIIPADIDETELQEADDTPVSIALNLAYFKAAFISKENPDAYVIGADQILVCDDQIITKAKSKDEAREKLKFLRGKTHYLISAAHVVRGNVPLWDKAQTAFLTMYDFDDDFLERYLEKAGEALTRSVGAYEVESIGIRLFEMIEGDHFTIQGMPLLPLLEFLQETEEFKL